MKKKEDGCYYEKIIEWQESPKYRRIIFGSLFMLCGLIFSFLLEGEANAPELDFVLHIVIYIIGLLVSTFGMLFMGIYLLFTGLGCGRKVKYRRIGK